MVKSAHWEKRENYIWDKESRQAKDGWVLVEDSSGAWLRWSSVPKEEGQVANKDELAGVN